MYSFLLAFVGEGGRVKVGYASVVPSPSIFPLNMLNV